MKSSVRLGKLFGIPLEVSYTWFLIFAIVTLGLRYYFPQNYPGWSQALYWIVAAGTSLLFFGSVVVHELFHSLVAIHYGIPVKSITLFLFGGVSTITKEVDRPSRELWLAISGPISSLVLGGLFYLAYSLTRSVAQPIAAASLYLAGINVLLGVFNMLPGFPLDGGRVFRAIVWGVTGNYRKSTQIATVLGRAFGYLLIVGGILIALFTGNWQTGLWFAFIGWFLENAASQTYRQTMLREYLRGYTAGDLMRADCATISSDTTLQSLVDDTLLPSGRRCFMVTDGTDLRGLVTLHDIRAVPRSDWPLTRVADAMTRLDRMHAVAPEADAFEVIEKMDGQDINQVPVVQDGKLVGVIARDSILHFLRLRSELGE